MCRYTHCNNQPISARGLASKFPITITITFTWYIAVKESTCYISSHNTLSCCVKYASSQSLISISTRLHHRIFFFLTYKKLSFHQVNAIEILQGQSSGQNWLTVAAVYIYMMCSSHRSFKMDTQSYPPIPTLIWVSILFILLKVWDHFYIHTLVFIWIRPWYWYYYCTGHIEPLAC